MSTEGVVIVLAVLAVLALAIGVYRYRARLRISVPGIVDTDADFSREPRRRGVRGRKLRAGRNVHMVDRAEGDVDARNITAGGDIGLEREERSSGGD